MQTVTKDSRAQTFKWLAVAPAAVGAVLAFFAATWTEWPQAIAAAIFLAIAAAIWRAFSGTWPFVAMDQP